MSTTDAYEIPHLYQSNRRSQAPRDEHGFLIQPETYSSPPYPDSEISYDPPKFSGLSNPIFEASDLSVEEIRREFSPSGPGLYYKDKNGSHSSHNHTSNYTTHRPLSRDEYESDRDTLFSSHKSHEPQDRPSTTSFKESKSRRQSLSRNELLMVAAGGAALAVGAKELWDRKKSEGRQTHSSHFQTATMMMGMGEEYAAYEDRHKHIKARDSSKSRTDHGRDHHKFREPKPIRYQRSRSGHGSTICGEGQTRGRKKSNDNLNSGRHGRWHHSGKRLQQLAKTALLAGAAEAFRVRKEPGGWAGVKGKRVLTAAIGASTLNNLTDGNSGRLLEAILGGLASNHLLNSSRHQDDSGSIDRRYHSRSRSRSRSRGSTRNGTDFITTLVSSGLNTLAGNENIQHRRSQSKSNASRRNLENPHSHRRSNSSSGHNHSKHRHESKSVVDFARKGLAALGLSSKDDKEISQNSSEHRKSHRIKSDSDHSQSHPRHQHNVNSETHHHRISKHHHHRDHSVASKRSVNMHGQNDRHRSRNGRDYGKSSSGLDSSDDNSWSPVDGKRYKRRE